MVLTSSIFILAKHKEIREYALLGNEMDSHERLRTNDMCYSFLEVLMYFRLLQGVCCCLDESSLCDNIEKIESMIPSVRNPSRDTRLQTNHGEHYTEFIFINIIKQCLINKVNNEITCYLITRVADPGWFYPDPNLTFEKKLDPDPSFEKSVFTS